MRSAALVSHHQTFIVFKSAPQCLHSGDGLERTPGHGDQLHHGNHTWFDSLQTWQRALRRKTMESCTTTELDAINVPMTKIIPTHCRHASSPTTKTRHAPSSTQPTQTPKPATQGRTEARQAAW